MGVHIRRDMVPGEVVHLNLDSDGLRMKWGPHSNGEGEMVFSEYDDSNVLLRMAVPSADIAIVIANAFADLANMMAGDGDEECPDDGSAGNFPQMIGFFDLNEDGEEDDD